MISQTDRCIIAYAYSVGLFFIELLKPTPLQATEQVVEQGVLNSRDVPPVFLEYFFPETFFLKISENPSQTLAESLMTLVGVLLVLLGLWFLRKPRVRTQSVLGFQLLNLGEQNRFIPLKSEAQTLEFLSQVKTSKKYRLSANLNRVTLTPRQNTLLLEDKNYKNALLINRRRSHRTVLCDNDVLDVGEMVLLFRNPGVPAGKIYRPISKDLQLPIVGMSHKGPISAKTPILIVAFSQQEIPLVRNLNTLGTSKFNDIILESDEVALRHAKIYKVGESWKIQNLQIQETTSVNGRRIDQRFLHDGDEVVVGNVLFKFSTSKARSIKVRKPIEETAKKS